MDTRATYIKHCITGIQAPFFNAYSHHSSLRQRVYFICHGLASYESCAGRFHDISICTSSIEMSLPYSLPTMTKDRFFLNAFEQVLRGRSVSSVCEIRRWITVCRRVGKENGSRLTWRIGMVHPDIRVMVTSEEENELTECAYCSSPSSSNSTAS